MSNILKINFPINKNENFVIVITLIMNLLNLKKMKNNIYSKSTFIKQIYRIIFVYEKYSKNTS